MIIAINTRAISGNNSINHLLVNHILRLAALYTEHQFVLIAQKEIKHPEKLANVRQHLLPQQLDNTLLWKLWYHYKLPAAVRKLKADVLLSTDGILSKRVKIPQYLLVSDTGYLPFPELYPSNYARFARLNSGDFFRKAKKLIVISEHQKQEIIKQYKISETKITVWHPGIAAMYQAVSATDSETFKSQHTEGKDYILFYGAIENKNRLVNILKAFSLFKKRLKTNMQLLLAAPEIPQEHELVKSLTLYKYRDDVKLLAVPNEKTLATMIGAAYACINLSPAADDSIFLLQSIKSAVPVIAGNYHGIISLINNAASFADPLSVDMIAEKMMLLYKDEKKRTELIREGLDQVNEYDEKKATAALANLLLQ